jgi:HPt (histidine-containing phosphotransfer) domain-containing protein
MDHMMPELDGVEATEAIRGLYGDYFKSVPIIALTANAVSGMREMFLSKGFNDYIAKPIEMFKLNEIMDKWIPREKHHKTIAEQITEPEPELDPPLVIDGIDTKHGIEMTGRSESSYREVLALFCRDADERLEMLKEVPNEETLKLFITQVHALKSAASSIGAAKLSESAELLEQAGKRGDIALIRAKLDIFRVELIVIVSNIRAAAADNAEEADVQHDTLDVESMQRLCGALEERDVEALDAILSELSAKSFESAVKGVITEISDLVLMGNYNKAEEMADRLKG